MPKIVHVGYLLIIAGIAIKAWPQTAFTAAGAIVLPSTANAKQPAQSEESANIVAAAPMDLPGAEKQHLAQLDELRRLERRKQELIVARSEAYPQRMRIEPRDSEWAVQIENHFADTLITDERLRNLPVVDVQCRSSICSVTFSANLPEPSEQIHQLLRALRQYEWYQEFNHSSFSDAVENDVYTLYLERTGAI